MTNLPTNKRTLGQFLGQPLGWLYGMGAYLHRAAYVYGPLEQVRFAPLVISVGNLSVGGTGKSPHVLYLQGLLGQVTQTAMVSRGYGRQSKGLQWVEVDSAPEQVGDEPLQFKQAYPAATVVVAERRVEGIRAALVQVPDLQTILLDDALQHWAVEADCHILLTTFDAPFFQQTILPFGRLREFRKGYQRADVIIVSKCPTSLEEDTRAAYITAINPLAHQRVLFSNLAYQPLYELGTRSAGPDLEEGEPLDILLLTGIANPQALEVYLGQQGHQVTSQTFPDHHAFTVQDLQNIQVLATGKTIITTEKDATKLRPLLIQHPAFAWIVYVLPIQVVLSASDEAWLSQYLQQKKRLHPPHENSH